MRAAGTIALVVLFVTPPFHQATTPLSYRQIVDRYRVSPNDGVEQMLRLPEQARKDAIDAAIADDSGWTWDELAAAAMLHTDAGLYFLSKKQPYDAQLADAERLLGRTLRVTPARTAFTRRWYTMAQATLERFGEQAAAKSLATHFRDRLRDTPQRAKALTAYHDGVAAEFDGSRKGEFLTVVGLTESGGNPVQRYFVPAARELMNALELDPDLLEAALHLGRIRLLQGRDADASLQFRRAAQSTARPVAHLAHLFLGSLAERGSKWDEAEAQYRRAAALFPNAQSATLALAQLLDRRDRGAEAAQELAVAVGLEGGRRFDPWWFYFDEAGAEPGALLAVLRAEVLK
jgi:tetratricopeptide (TPR) repeat protein